MSYMSLPAVFGWQANVFKVLMHSDLGVDATLRK